jgi:hypothetical protein
MNSTYTNKSHDKHQKLPFQKEQEASLFACFATQTWLNK